MASAMPARLINQAPASKDRRDSATFIDEGHIQTLLAQNANPSAARAREILARARRATGLTPEEAAVLLQVDDPEVVDEMLACAREVKEAIYGKRIVLFAPLYLSNFCVNNCAYCGYAQKRPTPRRRLSQEEIAREVRILERLGHKRLALEAGEDPLNCPIDYVLDSIRTIYGVCEGNGNIRRVNVNIAATTTENYQRLKEAGIGTYILFQETYHRETYGKMHPSGPKADYDWHALAMDRAMAGGIDDVGLGVLFGLYDFRFEVLGLLYHARHLEDVFGVGPHTISVPRLRPARGVELDRKAFPYLVSDDEFRRLVAVIRLAVPYTGMILSTREEPGFRDEVISYGISQVSAGSCTGVGGYQEEYGKEYGIGSGALAGNGPENGDRSELASGSGAGCGDAAQFEVGDRRSPNEVLQSLCRGGYIPSYCTACYRNGRTGDRFMALAKTGRIQNVCQPNALLTFQEYLLDYADAETRALGEKTIREHVALIPSTRVRAETLARLERIKSGERDLYF